MAETQFPLHWQRDVEGMVSFRDSGLQLFIYSLCGWWTGSHSIDWPLKVHILFVVYVKSLFELHKVDVQWGL